MTERQQKSIGVIDALSTGYGLLVRHWPLLLIPLLLDLFFWLGPQISPWMAFKSLMDMSDPEFQEILASTLGMERLDLSVTSGGSNVLTALVRTPGAPGSLAAALGILPPPPGWHPMWLAPVSPGGLIGLVVLLLLLGTPVAGLYVALVARAVRGSSPGEIGNLWRHWFWCTVQLAAFIVLALLVMAIVILGLSVALVVARRVNIGLAAGILGLGLLFISWAMVISWLFLYFVPASIALHKATIFQAIVASTTFVWRNLWSSMGLILISTLISEGFARIWQHLFTNALGVLISLGGNAFLTTGLTLGAFVFFQERYSSPQQ